MNTLFNDDGANTVRIQNATGTVTNNQNKDDMTYDNGYLAFGQVLKVYPKSYCADVQIFHTNDKFRSSHVHEGKHGCKIGVSSAGFSDLYKAAYGEILPIYRGNIVLVGFLKNSQDQPVIIKVFHDISETVGTVNFRNILPNDFNNYTTTGDITDYLKITPIQDFIKVDKYGNVELASHTKAFLIAREGMIPDTFDYEDLSVKSTIDKSVINPLSGIATEYDDIQVEYHSENLENIQYQTISVDEKYSAPKSYLLSFRDKYLDKLTNWLKILVDATKTSLRIFKFQQEKKKSTLFSIEENGTIKIRRQLDAMEFNDFVNTKKTELNPEQNPSKKYSEIQLLEDGSIILETIDRTTADETIEEGFTSMREVEGDESKDFPHTKIIIKPEGGNIDILTNSKMTAYAKKGIDMMSKENINITSEKIVNIYGHKGINEQSPQDIVINSQKRTQISSNSKVEMFAPDMDMIGNMEMKGSFDMTGAFDLLGNATFTGAHYINGRGAILGGDVDSNLDVNEVNFADNMVSIAESFLRNELAKHNNSSSAASAALAGIINVSSSGFTTMDVFFDGTATDLYQSLSMNLIKENSPYYAQLVQYGEENNLNILSVITQIDFLKDVLGIDLNTLGAEGGNSSVVDSVNVIYNTFAKPNYLMDEITKAVTKSKEYTFTDTEITTLYNILVKINVELNSSALTEDLPVTSYNWLMGRDPTPVGIITHEGDRLTLPGASGLPGDSKYATATVEDAINSINGYFKTNLFKLVQTAEIQADGPFGTNSQQYAFENRKKTGGSSGSSGASGGFPTGSNVEYTPAPINNKSQFLDRVIKRYFFNVGETILKQANASLKYYSNKG